MGGGKVVGEGNHRDKGEIECKSTQMLNADGEALENHQQHP